MEAGVDNTATPEYFTASHADILAGRERDRATVQKTMDILSQRKAPNNEARVTRFLTMETLAQVSQTPVQLPGITLADQVDLSRMAVDVSHSIFAAHDNGYDAQRADVFHKAVLWQDGITQGDPASSVKYPSRKARMRGKAGAGAAAAGASSADNQSDPERKMSNRIIQPIEEQLKRQFINEQEDVVLPPPTKRARLDACWTPASLSPSTLSSALLPLATYQTSVTSDSRIPLHDPLASVLFNVATPPISGLADDKEANESKRRLIAINSSSSGVAPTDRASVLRLKDTVNVWEPLVTVAAKRHKRQADIPAGIAAQYRLQTAARIIPNGNSGSSSSSSSNNNDVMEGLLQHSWTANDEITKRIQQATSEDYQDVYYNSRHDIMVKQRLFQEQMEADWRRSLEFDNIQNDPFITDLTRRALEKLGQENTATTTTLPPYRANKTSVQEDEKAGGIFMHRIDRQSAYVATIEEKQRQLLLQRGVIFRSVLAEELERLRRHEPCYSTRGSRELLAQTLDSITHPEIPLVDREYLEALSREPSQEQLDQGLRLCVRGDQCICRTFSEVFRGVFMPSTRPTHGTVNGIAPMTQRIPGLTETSTAAGELAALYASEFAPSSATAATLSAAAAHSKKHRHHRRSPARDGLVGAGHGFIAFELLLPDEMTRWQTTGQLPTERRECVKCHILSVVRWYTVTRNSSQYVKDSRFPAKTLPINLFQVRKEQFGADALLEMDLTNPQTAIVAGHFPLYLPDCQTYVISPATRLKGLATQGQDFRPSSAE